MSEETAMQREHDLKVWSKFYAAVESGCKTFEIRYNDRSFMVGDVLLLREWDDPAGYSGRECRRIVTYVTDWRQDDGYVVLGLSAHKPEAATLPEDVRQAINQAGDDPVAKVTAIVREADRTFQRIGGSTRHWVRDCFLPALNSAGIAVVGTSTLRDLAIARQVIDGDGTHDPDPIKALGLRVCLGLQREENVLLKADLTTIKAKLEQAEREQEESNEQLSLIAVRLSACGVAGGVVADGVLMLATEYQRLQQSILSTLHRLGDEQRLQAALRAERDAARTERDDAFARLEHLEAERIHAA